MNSDTPRMDNVWRLWLNTGSAAFLLKEGSTLERELNAAKAELEKLKAKPLGNWNNSLADFDPYDAA